MEVTLENRHPIDIEIENNPSPIDIEVNRVVSPFDIQLAPQEEINVELQPNNSPIELRPESNSTPINLNITPTVVRGEVQTPMYLSDLADVSEAGGGVSGREDGAVLAYESDGQGGGIWKGTRTPTLQGYATTEDLEAGMATAVAAAEQYADEKKSEVEQTIDSEIADVRADHVSDMTAVNRAVSQTNTRVHELETAISRITGFETVIVQALPTPSLSTSGKMYLVPMALPQLQNLYDKYITILRNGAYIWERIGVPVDLSSYATKDELAADIASVSAYAESVAAEAYAAGAADLAEASMILSEATAAVDERLTSVDAELTEKYNAAKEELEDARVRLSDAEDEILGAKERIATAESDISTARVDIDESKGEIEAQAERLDVAEGTITTVGVRLSAAEGTINSHGHEIDTINEHVSDVDLTLDAHNSLITANASRLDVQEGKITEAGIAIDGANARIDLQAEEINTVEGRVSTAEVAIDGAEASIDLLASDVNVLDGSVSSLGTRMNAAEGTITTFNNWKNTATGQITAMEEQWDSIDATITTSVATQLSTPGSTIKTGVETVVDGKAGSIVTTAVQTVTEDIDGILEESSSFSQVSQDTEAVKVTVGDATNGLVHDVAALEITATGLTSRITAALDDPDNPGTDLVVSQIKQTADEISEIVTNGDNYAAIIARLNEDTSSEVIISANKIYLTGQTIAEKILAGQGTTIAGWTFTSGGIANGNILLKSNGTIENRVVQAGQDDIVYWALNPNGSGSVAQGGIQWTGNGVISFAQDIKIGGLQSDITLGIISQLSFLKNVFEVRDAQGVVIPWSSVEQRLADIAYLGTTYNFYSTQEVTAGGVGQSSSVSNVLYGLADVSSVYDDDAPVAVRRYLGGSADRAQAGDILMYDSSMTGKWSALQSGRDNSGQIISSRVGKVLTIGSTGIPEWADSQGGSGTVQSVKMNNGTPIQPDASGVVDLGTVITSLSGYATENWVSGNYLAATLKGAANGLAELGSDGKVPSSQLPSYVDDVLEFSSKSAFPATGESGKIYVALDTNLTYRWSGTAYVEISPSLALGETSSTAYRGDRGKIAYDHSQESGNPHNTTWAQIYSASGSAKILTDYIADSAITTGKIADLAVTTGKIADLAITTGKIAANAVTIAKLESALSWLSHCHYSNGTLVLGDENNAINFAAYGEVTAGGVGSGGGGGGGLASVYFNNTRADDGETAKFGIKINGSWAAVQTDSTYGKYISINTSAGSVTSVGLSVPTGFSVTGSPVTSSGTLAISFASGYSLPTTAKQTEWDNKQNALGYTPVNKAGDTITGTLSYNNGGPWISARDHCAVKTTRTSSEGSDWHPVVGIKTSAGFWSFGSVGGETLCFSHDTDSDYTAGRNTSTVINMPLKAGTIALTSDIPTSLSQLSADTTHRLVTDTQITAWNAKWDYNENTIKAVKVDNAGNADNADTVDSLHANSFAQWKTYSSPDVAYDFGWGQIEVGSGSPTGAQYGQFLTMPYRKATGNITPDFAWQIFGPNGDDPTNPDDIFVRTSRATSWRTWHKLYHSGNCNNTSTPWSCSNLTASGTVAPSADKAYTLGTASAYWDDFYVKGVIHAYHYNKASNQPFIVFDKPGSYGVGIGPDGTANRIKFGPVNDLVTTNPSWIDGSTFSSNEWYFQGNIVATGDVTAGTSSDSRFKDNQQSLRNADAVLKALRPMEFDWNDLYHSVGGRNEGHDVGFLAQDVQPLIPSAIGKVYGDYLRLDYNKVTPYLVAGWQSHETRIERLERENRELKMEIQRLQINS